MILTLVVSSLYLKRFSRQILHAGTRLVIRCTTKQCRECAVAGLGGNLNLRQHCYCCRDLHNVKGHKPKPTRDTTILLATVDPDESQTNLTLSNITLAIMSDGAAVLTTILTTILNKESDYRDGIRKNHDPCKLVADRLAVGGELEESLLMFIKGSDGENLIPEEEIKNFLQEQRERVKALSEKNVARDRSIDAFVGSLRSLKQKVSSGNEELYQEGTNYEIAINELMAQEKARIASTEVDVKQAPMCVEIRSKLGEKEVLAGGGQEDDDIEVVRNNHDNGTSLKCPFTAMYMEDAVKSKLCGHTYSRQGIINHIKHSRGGGAKCPFPGCTNANVTEAQLEEDGETRMRVKRQIRRDQKEEEHRKMSQAMDDDDEEEELL
jgi:hypothetical protein